MLKVADRVRETTNAAGLNDILLQGALGGYRTAASAFISGDQIPYVISKGNEYEIGEGTLTSGSPWALSRDVVKSSSNNNQKINVTLGMIVFVDATKSYLDSFKSDVAASVSELVTASVSASVSALIPDIVSSITSTLSLTSSYENYYSLPLPKYGINKRIHLIPSDSSVAIAFDGTHMWVCNFSSNNVSKINVSTNNIDATISVGIEPSQVAFDGTHMWVSNSNNVSKINVSTNNIDATISSIYSGYMLFDGTHMYNGYDKINVSTNNIDATISYYPLAFDDTHMWVSNSNNVLKINMSTNNIDATISVGGYSVAIAFDGTHMWVCNFSSNNVSKINVSTNNIDATISVDSPSTIVFDGTHMWLKIFQAILKINVSTNNIVATFPYYNNGVAFDGTHMWFCASTYINKISKYYM